MVNQIPGFYSVREKVDSFINMAYFLCVFDVMLYSGEYDVCDVSPSVYAHRAG